MGCLERQAEKLKALEKHSIYGLYWNFSFGPKLPEVLLWAVFLPFLPPQQKCVVESSTESESESSAEVRLESLGCFDGDERL